MGKTEPIRNLQQLTEFRDYYRITVPNPRNYAMIVFGLNTALRISDILETTWGMVYNFETGHYREHLYLREQKTGKKTVVPLNAAVVNALKTLQKATDNCQKERYLFPSQKNLNSPISRSQAYRIVKKAAVHARLPEHISCHSMRKTFGYHAWKNGTPPALIMAIFNHSSYQITKRYLCIEQEEKDGVFMGLNL